MLHIVKITMSHGGPATSVERNVRFCFDSDLDAVEFLKTAYSSFLDYGENQGNVSFSIETEEKTT